MLYLLLHFCFIRNVLDVVTWSAPIACTTDFNLTFYFFSSIVHVVVSRQFRLSATDNTPLWDSNKLGRTWHYIHWMTQPRMWNAKCEFFPYACLANQPGKAPAARLPPESSPMNFPFTCLANQPGKAPAARLPPESSPMDFPMLYRQASSAERIQQNSKSLLDPFLFFFLILNREWSSWVRDPPLIISSIAGQSLGKESSWVQSPSLTLSSVFVFCFFLFLFLQEEWSSWVTDPSLVISSIARESLGKGSSRVQSPSLILSSFDPPLIISSITDSLGPLGVSLATTLLWLTPLCFQIKT